MEWLCAALSAPTQTAPLAGPAKSEAECATRELINRSLLIGHEHVACAPIELLEVVKTPSGADRILHQAPEAFDGIEVMATMGR